MIRPFGDKIAGAARVIILGHLSDGREAVFLQCEVPDGVDLNAAAESGSAIDLPELVDWFADAGRLGNLPVPSRAVLHEMRRDLNIVRVTDCVWRLSRPDPRAARIRKAVDALAKDLPHLLEATRIQEASTSGGQPPWWSKERLHLIQSLAHAVENAKSELLSDPRPPHGRRPWHDVADLVAWHATKAWESAGVREVGIGKAASPAVGLVARALVRLGEGAVEPEAISKALSRRKKNLPVHRGQFSVVSQFEMRRR